MTWQKNSWLPQFFEFRPEILHAYVWMHMQSNNDEKKYRFFDPFTGEAPLKEALHNISRQKWDSVWILNTSE